MAQDPSSPVPHLAHARAVGGELATMRFGAERVRALAGSLSPHELSAMDPGELARRLRGDRALGALVRLLLAGHSLPVVELEGQLGPDCVATLRNANVVQQAAASSLRATVAVSPADDLLIASDRPDLHHAGKGDFVLGVGPATHALAQLLIRRPLRTALDLGCGSGYLACTMARHARRVVATDVNPRAVAFARFNAAMNGLSNVDCRNGSLFEPCEQGETFDLIACNPPYVIAPARTFLYRDGEPDVCSRIAALAPRYLTDGGTLQMALNWPQRRDVDWRNELERWFDHDDCGTLLLSGRTLSAAQYAALWVQQQRADPPQAREQLARWLTYFHERGIEAVGSGFANLRRHLSGKRWMRIGALPAFSGPAGETVARVLAAHELLALHDDRELLEMRLRPARQLERIERSRLGENGFRARSIELRLPEGLCFAARVDPMAPRLVERLDGHRTLAQAGECLAASLQWPADAFCRSLPTLARRLLELGMLEPVEHSAESVPRAPRDPT